MPQEANKLHKWTAIAAAIVFCLDAMIELYNYVQYNQYPMFSNPWYCCAIFIPIALNLILAIFLFRRKKDIAAGCIFVFHIIYPILIEPLFYIMWTATDHVVVQSDSSNWLGMLLMRIGSAYFFLMALDCFLSGKQTLRNARITFLILPVLSVVCNIIKTIVHWPETGITLDASTIFTMAVGNIIFSYAPTILTGLSFFLSYSSKPVSEVPVQQ